MRRTSFERWPCSIARTADLLGDAWTLLVLREAFFGERRFDGFTDSLHIPRNTLSDRLGRLVDAGLLDRRPYRSDPVRHDYVLTDKGRDLFGVLAALNAWGDAWLAGEAGEPVLLRHDSCGHDTHAEVVCAHCKQPLTSDEVTPRPGPGYPLRLLEEPAVQRRFAGRHRAGERTTGWAGARP